MIKPLVFAASSLLLAGAADPAFAKSVKVVDPWIAAPPMGAPTAAGYAVIQNVGADADALVSATTPDAEKLQVHSMSMAGGVMRMRPVTAPLPVAPGQSLKLARGGDYHFMVIRPTHPLKAGDRVPATLTFARAGAVKVIFVVKAPTDAGMAMR